MSDLLEFTKWLTKEYAVENAVIGLRKRADVPVSATFDPGPVETLQAQLNERTTQMEGWHREFLASQQGLIRAHEKLDMLTRSVKNHEEWADLKRTEALNTGDQSGADHFEEVMTWTGKLLKELGQ